MLKEWKSLTAEIANTITYPLLFIYEACISSTVQKLGTSHCYWPLSKSIFLNLNGKILCTPQVQIFMILLIEKRY